MYGTKINKDRAVALANKGSPVYDVRDAVAYRDDAIPGSHNLSLRQISTIQRLPRATPLIFVGDTKTDKSTLQMSLQYAFMYGFTHINYVDRSGD